MENSTIWIIGGIIVVVILVYNNPSLISTGSIVETIGPGYLSYSYISEDEPLVLNFGVDRGMSAGGVYPQSKVSVFVDDIKLLDVSQQPSIDGTITLDKSINSCIAIVNGVSQTCLINGNQELINLIYNVGTHNLVMNGTNYLSGYTGSHQEYGCASWCSGGSCSQSLGDKNCKAMGFNGIGGSASCGSGQISCSKGVADYGLTGQTEVISHSLIYSIAPKPCLLQPNQLIAAEIFPSGVAVSDNTLRYPTAQWCGEHPPKVYDKNTRTFTNRYDLFNRLKNGESLVVPSGESWIVFTVIDNNPEIPQLCDQTLYYDVDKKICTDLAGIVIVCPIGYGFENGVCVAPVKEEIIRLTMKNTGSQKLYNISLVQAGTTPPKLYNAFSQLKEFELEPNGQVVFYANLDMSQFNGTVPFQMMFSTKYTFQGNEYSLVKFTEPLVLNFINGGIIP